MSEEAISITTPHGQADGYFYRPEGHGPSPGVLFFTDGSGIRQAKRDMAARLAAAGYAVLMPNPYYRDGPIREMDHPGSGRGHRIDRCTLWRICQEDRRG